QKGLILAHAGGRATVGISKVIEGAGAEVFSGGLSTPVSAYLIVQGLANTTGAVGEAYQGVIKGNGENALFYHQLGVYSGTISGEAASIIYAHNHPDANMREVAEHAAAA